MHFDIHRAQEILTVIHPYLRWLLLGLYALMFLYVNRIIMNDPKLRDWFLSSMTDSKTGKSSGKALTAFVFAKLLAFATLCAIVYAPNHLLPQYFLITLVTFVAALYGIKMASQYLSPTESNSNTQQQNSVPDSVDNKDSGVNDNAQNNGCEGNGK